MWASLFRSCARNVAVRRGVPMVLRLLVVRSDAATASSIWRVYPKAVVRCAPSRSQDRNGRSRLSSPVRCAPIPRETYVDAPSGGRRKRKHKCSFDQVLPYVRPLKDGAYGRGP